jgi:hypothetical protein
MLKSVSRRFRITNIMLFRRRYQLQSQVRYSSSCMSASDNDILRPGYDRNVRCDNSAAPSCCTCLDLDTLSRPLIHYSEHPTLSGVWGFSKVQSRNQEMPRLASGFDYYFKIVSFRYMGLVECGARPRAFNIFEIRFIILHSLFASGCSRLSKLQGPPKSSLFRTSILIRLCPM